MKILVLGNGFDLDHNLPTSYMDFLNFCNYILDMDEPDSPKLQKLKPLQINYTEILRTNEEVKNTFLAFLKDNYLLNYFNSKIEAQGNDWIDFESEIRNIVSKFKFIEFEFKHSNQNSYHTDSGHKIHQVLHDLGLDSEDLNFWDEMSLSSIHRNLCNSLNSFSHALEYYIWLFINHTPVEGISPDIIDFEADKVLTFNYSDTYERVYGGVRWDEAIDHVHGIALNTLNKEPNIILGITSNEENLENYYVEFEKYFQRITKRTGNEYSKWLQQRHGIDEKIEIMFFGHSLDATDSDIIRELICYEKSTIKIYYYDETAHQQIVANLIEIIGKENLIKYVSGSNPKIELFKQQIHIAYNTAGIEITRDIRTLYRLHSLNNHEIENLLLKLKSKIETKDLSYFYSQKKVISLFEALKYHSIDFADRQTFFAICKKLNFERNKNGKVVIYQEEEWYDHTPWGDDPPCDKETATLIREINKYNKNQSSIVESSKIYASILTADTSEKIKDGLIDIFSEENPDKNYWNQLRELIGLMFKNQYFRNALDLICMEDLPLPIKAKAKYFESTYEEYRFNIEYAKQMSETPQYDEAN